jgi:hypothetical protein
MRTGPNSAGYHKLDCRGWRTSGDLLFFRKVLTRVAEIWLGGLPALEDVYYLVPLPPSPLANEIMGLAGIFCFGL